MRSIGIDLQPHLDSGRLRIVAQRPFLYGLEMHLVSMHKEINRFHPAVVVVDPISNLISAGTEREVTSMLTLLVDFLKSKGITGFFTVLIENGGRLETSDVGISSLIDTWMLVRDIEISGERNRGLYVLKSRGMNHSNQIREFLLGSKGIKLVEVYLGPAGMLTGSARVALEEQERDASIRQADAQELKLAQLERRRKVMEAQIEALRADFEAEAAEVEKALSLESKREKRALENQSAMAKSRRANGHLSQNSNRK
jgi:circadian clock protein KaiC